jgi:NitT/TauT family transport system substrate-binding protein
LISVAVLAAACSDNGADQATTTVPQASAPSADAMTVEAGQPLPSARCEANKAAGTIKYDTGFDFAAAASIIEVVVAEAKGYYDDLCLNVVLTPSFSTANYPLVGSNDVQFSSAGSFSELASAAAANQADLVALSVDGHTAIDVLMVHPEKVASLADIKGTTIGVKGAMPPAVAVMLKQEAGLTEGAGYQTVLLDGFDPTAHWALPNISAVPGWRSNEPGALERAGLSFKVYDPADYGIPGSFGLIYTNRAFLTAHPTAADDFMRATMKGLADAIADPAAAAAIAVDRINGNGNPNFLSPEGETFRWTTDAKTVVDSTPAGVHIGVPVASELEAQIKAYDAVGVYGDAGAPTTDGLYDTELVANLYAADGTVIWPG